MQLLHYMNTKSNLTPTLTLTLTLTHYF